MKILTDLQDAAQSIPDSAKLAAVATAQVLSVMGISLEDWTYILSAIVSVFFILEKLPMVINRVRTFNEWVRRKKQK